MIVTDKRLLFQTALRDSWYATGELALLIEYLHKIHFCLLKSNQKVNDMAAKSTYQVCTRWIHYWHRV
ncbi:hypothetical protein METHB2_120051 [Candidatus Methylobacter favarea]|uniref:Uncharacterized protein n=1 Tax=Candidatus Methylobacter favarea TaxID=2707345 RepID=A0A8S0XEG4_9GAMM|nr:hypothetical protein [Candidatus Methylobacter favarea]CAA9889692.1 hypothetical protein METHB2_120051 [Candidatus Methylobacter favarea]